MEPLILNLNDKLTFDYDNKQALTELSYGDYTLKIKCGANTLSYPKWILPDMNAYTFYEVQVLNGGSAIDISSDDYFKYLFTLYPNFAKVTNNSMQLIQANIVTLMEYIKESKNYIIPTVVNPWML